MHRLCSVSVALLAWGFSACGAESPEDENRHEAASRSRSIGDADLTLGARGASVRAVHGYLMRHGYFPNDELAGRYPAWRPLVAAAPAAPDVYDESSVAAVRAFQKNFGLDETGVVDAATRALMLQARCGVPEGIETPARGEKFALNGSTWRFMDLTWRVVNAERVTLAEARNAARGAFALWEATTSLRFIEITAPPGQAEADVEIVFGAWDGPGGDLAVAFPPADGGDVFVDNAEAWSVAVPPPDGAQDLQTVLIHEIGHSLGLSHSSFGGVKMFPFVLPFDRSLSTDDRVAISVLYDVWRMLPGCAKDIGVGANTTVWAIGCSSSADGVLHRWNGASWIRDSALGAGALVDVAPNGVPWVVHSSGSIFRRSSDSAVSGSWIPVPGCAKDIGIGTNGNVWAIGCSGTRDGLLHKWNGSGWNVDSAGVAGARVTVERNGAPWVVQSGGAILRRSSSNVFSGTWIPMPGLAKDIGLSSGNYAWALGVATEPGGFQVHVWNQQPAAERAPAREVWIRRSGGAIMIDVGPNGLPWVVNDLGSIFTLAP